MLGQSEMRMTSEESQTVSASLYFALYNGELVYPNDVEVLAIKEGGHHRIILFETLLGPLVI